MDTENPFLSDKSFECNVKDIDQLQKALDAISKMLSDYGKVVELVGRQCNIITKDPIVSMTLKSYLFGYLMYEKLSREIENEEVE